MTSLGRRTLLASSSALLTPIAPGLKVAFGADGPAAQRDILIVVFLRFGCDGLTLVPPADDADYHAARPTLAVRASGATPALPIGSLDGVQMFLHPNMPELKALYDERSLAVIHAAGLETESRSHFLSQDKVERGIADGEAQIKGGWLGRHLLARNLALPGLGAITGAPEVDVSLQGYAGAVAVPDITRFDIAGGDINLSVIEAMHVGPEAAVNSARATIDTIKTVKSRLLSTPRAPRSESGYSAHRYSTAMKSIADIIKAGVGMEVATVDLDGWDHHVGLLNFFPGQAREVSTALSAFWTDIKPFRERVTLVAMTEFGRRVEENANGGLDHGAASAMLVLGGNVNGGQVYGRWPGLKPANLRSGDLAVATDYRLVLSEILAKRRGETTLGAVFPTVDYRPLGLIRSDLRG